MQRQKQIHRWWKLSAPQGDTSCKSLLIPRTCTNKPPPIFSGNEAPRGSLWLCAFYPIVLLPLFVCCWCISQSNTLCLTTKQELTTLTACWLRWTLQCSLAGFRKHPLPLVSIEFLRIQLPSTALNFSMWFRQPFDVAFIFLLKIHLFVSLSCKKFGLTLITLHTIAFH